MLQLFNIGFNIAEYDGGILNELFPDTNSNFILFGVQFIFLKD